jgi:hypothetical protein
MRLELSKALVTAVTSFTEKNGEVHIPGGKAVKLKFVLAPHELGKHFSEQLEEMLFKGEFPREPKVGALPWTPEYENAVFRIAIHDEDRERNTKGNLVFSDEEADKLTFTAAKLGDFEFAAREGFLVDVSCTVKVNANKLQNGELDYMLRQNVDVSIKKAVQATVQQAEAEAKGKEKEGGTAQLALPDPNAGTPVDEKGQVAVPENMTPLIPTTTH